MQRKIIIGFVLTLIIVIFIPVYWAMEPARQEAASERQKAEAVERGHELYASYCIACHGSEGEGIVGPALKGTLLGDKVLEKTISRGIPGTAMAAFNVEDGGPLKGHQIKDLVAFIKNWDSAPQTSPPPPPAPSTSNEQGKAIFEQSCKGCHSIGGGRIVGPDLKSVTERRELDWLIQFILAPDKVIAQGDSIAQQLLEEYGMPMPNMGLSESEAKEVLSYIEAQSAGEGQ